MKKLKINTVHISILIIGIVVFFIGLFEKGIETNLGWIKVTSTFAVMIICFAYTWMKMDNLIVPKT